MKKWLVFFALVLCASLAPHLYAQDQENPLLQFLDLPDPDCGVNWGMRTADFDSLLSNPLMRRADVFARMTEAKQGNDQLLTAQYLLGLARIYQYLDSAHQAQTYASQALSIFLRLQLQNQNAEVAYLVGRSYFYLEESDSSEAWYKRSAMLDSTYYLSVFELADNCVSEQDAKHFPWVEKSNALAMHLLQSDQPAKFRAQVASDYADLISGLNIMSNLKGWFSKILDLAVEDADSLQEDKMIGEFFNTFSGSIISPEVNALRKKASELDPTQVRYLLAYNAADLGQIFFTWIDAARKNAAKNPDASEDEVYRMLDRYRPEAFQIQQRLKRLSETDKIFYPVVNFYLAFTNVILGDVKQARWHVYDYLQWDPENSQVYGTQCGIMLSLMKEHPDSTRAFVDEIIEISSRKCRLRPTCIDCYRVGHIQMLVGSYNDALISFERASMGKKSDDDTKARIGVAAASFALGNDAKARDIISALMSASNSPSGEELISCAMLNASLYARNGEIETAIYWAEKANREAIKAEKMVEKTQQLLDLLHTIR